MKFLNERTTPPGGQFFYMVPETRVLFTDLTRRRLFERIRKHYQENELRIPDDLEGKVADFMCRRLPRGFCTGDDTGAVPMLTMSEVKRRTADAASGTKRVIPGEARRRAHVCANCPLNDRSACPTCSGLSAWAGRLGGVRVPGGNNFLGICRADGLALAAGVALEDVPVKQQVPEQCWRRRHGN